MQPTTSRFSFAFFFVCVLVIKSADGQVFEGSAAAGDEDGLFLRAGEEQGDTCSTLSSESCVKIKLDCPVRFKEESTKKIHVCENGVVCFGKPYYDYTPPLNNQELNKLKNKFCLAPYHADIDLPAGGKVCYRTYDVASPEVSAVESAVLIAEELVQEYYNKSLDALLVHVVTWVNASRNGAANETATFQSVYITDGFNTFAFFKYASDEMNFQQGPIFIGLLENKLANGLFDNGNSSYYVRPDRDVNSGTSSQGETSFDLTPAGDLEIDPTCACKIWHKKELPDMGTFNTYLGNMPDCPCTLALVQNDERFRNVSSYYSNVLSYALKSGFGEYAVSGKTCNYKNSNAGQFVKGGSAGAFERYNQIDNNNQYMAEDAQYQRICCVDSRSCDLFNEVRPRIRTCASTANAANGGGSGDPHISTIDGQEYTMNGLGEYILISADDLQIQARTSSATGKNGTVSAATVFSAFAVQVGTGCWIQAELQNQNSLKVLVGTNNTNWEDASLSYQSSKPITLNCGKAERQNQTLVLVFNTDVTVKVIVGTGLLQMEIKLDKKYSSKISGLLGNFDGDKTNDYKPRESSSPLPDTSSERKIFLEFANTWITTAEKSIFTYDNVSNHASFHFPNKIPAFYDELDKTDPKFKEAEGICENNAACIFDYMLTDNEELAKETSAILQQASETRAVLENQVPSATINTGTTIVNGENVLYATLNKDYVITLKGDDDGQFTFELVETTAQATLNDDGSVTLAVVDTNPVTLSVAARDNLGAVSPVVSVVIVLCTGCNSHGACNNDVLRKDDNRTTDDFKYSTCDCEPYWEGNDCEEDVDGCEGSPCGLSRTCQDVTADDHKQDPSGKGYTCGPCPTGYQADGDKCIDINECETTADCTQSCTNTDGSFTCQCNAGYRLAQDDKTCNDINECEESTDNCEQICTNTAGAFTCSCRAGFTFNEGTSKCDKENVPPAGCDALDCSKADGCTLDEDNAAVCFCNKGYELQQDKTCTNVDECAASPCRQNCTDTVGSFMCSCFIGYKQQDDKISCLNCTHPFYGDNCEEECIVGRGFLTCDPVRGSLCKVGWSGDDCDKDLNECEDANTPDICGGKNQMCTNTIGSYACTCLTGYKLEDDVCVDKNECDDPAINKCEQICINTVGSFSCSCGDDFVVDPNDSNRCTAIDECADGISGCEQFCTNNVLQSGFTCACQEGYKLNADGKSCSLVFDPCENFKENRCSQVCRVVSDEPKCSCKIGFVLAEDGRTCTDVNECDPNLDLNGCTDPNSCENLNGGYRCSCGNGFKLENDLRTCTGCDSSYFGENCASECACSEGAAMCDPKTGCVCKEGWAGEKCEIDINECGTSPCTGDNEECINTKGSYLCNCKTGYSRNQDEVCEDTDECGNALHDCAQICTNTPGSFQCSCHPGYQQEGTRCTDINECAGQHSCEQTCENADGSYSCTCNTGYKLDLANRISCLPKEQCPADNPCETNTECAVVEGQNKCSCLAGYQFVSQSVVRCEDILECSEDPSPCSQACTEQPGGFTCSCDQPGYKLDTDQVTCIVCSDGKYGAECSQDCTCNTENTVSCSNVDGKCTCKEGWSGNTCAENINECDTPAVHQCPENSQCVDTDGSFNCQCESGYIKSGDVCQVCSGAKYGAGCATDCACVQSNTEVCNNVDGSCTCKQGWEGSDCNQNINECSQNASICASVPNTRCIDKQGSYSCDCFVGFIKSLTDDTCSVCERGTFGVNCGQICQCNANKYESCNAVNGDCTCKAGWKSDDCNENIDECATNSFDCPPSSTCTDTQGSYVCNCDTGYTKTVNNTCEDNDECAQENGGCLQQCINTVGSFICSCNVGYQGTDDDCTMCVDSYGEQCANPCNCDPKRTTECHHVTGCVCKPGFIGVNCTDIDECAKATSVCQENSFCTNTAGGHTCTCNTGYIETQGNCEKCSGKRYGENCDNDCDCEDNNTVNPIQSCDHINGTCLCTAYWNGARCENSIDECALGTDNCTKDNEGCHDTDNGFNCSCNVGFVRDDNNNCVKDNTVTTTPALPGNRRRVHVEVRIDHNVNGDLKVSITYQNYLREVQYQLEIWYRKRLVSINFFIFNLKLSEGSLIADYDVDVPDGNVPDVAAANIDLATNKEPIPVFNQNGQVTNLAIANTTVPVSPTYSETLLCQIYEPSINNCGGEAECLVKDGKPYCEPKEEDDFALIFGLGFGIPMFLLCIAAVVVVVVFMRQRRKKLSHLKRLHRDDDSKSDSVFARQVPVRIVTSAPVGPMYGPPDLEPYAESEYSDFDFRPESEYHKREGQGSWNYMFGNLRPDEEYRIRRPNVDTPRGRYNY